MAHVNHIRSALVASALAVAFATAAQGASLTNAVTIKPAHGQSFDIGNKHTVAYFLAKKNVCDLTVMLAHGNEPDEIKDAAARMKFAVRVGGSARLETGDGNAVMFTCSNGAKSLTIYPVKTIAAL